MPRWDLVFVDAQGSAVPSRGGRAARPSVGERVRRAVIAAWLGARCCWIGCVGRHEDEGEWERIRALGIDVVRLRAERFDEAAARSVANVLCDTRMVVGKDGGAPKTQRQSKLNKTTPAKTTNAESKKSVADDEEWNMAIGMLEMATLARLSGARVLLDPPPRRAPVELLPLVDVVRLAPAEVSSDRGLAGTVARRLWRGGAGAVLLHTQSAGSLLVDEAGERWRPGAQPEADEVYAAAFAVSLSRGWQLDRACHFAEGVTRLVAGGRRWAWEGGRAGSEHLGGEGSSPLL